MEDKHIYSTSFLSKLQDRASDFIKEIKNTIQDLKPKRAQKKPSFIPTEPIKTEIPQTPVITNVNEIKTQTPKVKKPKVEKPKKEKVKKFHYRKMADERVQKVLVIGLSTLMISVFGLGVFLTYKDPLISQYLPNKTQKQTTPTPNQTPDWKTYINEGYGFKMKYPPDWNYEEVSWDGGSGETTVDYDGIKLKPNESTRGNTVINVYLIKNQGLNIREYFNVNDYSCCGAEATKTNLGDKIMSSETTTIDGAKGKVLFNAPEDIPIGGITANWIVVETNGKIYLLSYYLDQDEVMVDVIKVFDQILSNFKFIE